MLTRDRDTVRQRRRWSRSGCHAVSARPSSTSSVQPSPKPSSQTRCAPNTSIRWRLANATILSAYLKTRPVGDVIRRYLDVALDEPAVATVMTFGLSDRYTWLEEDFPRDDGMRRRPLPFDEELRPKPPYHALKTSLEQTRPRDPLWHPPRC